MILDYYKILQVHYDASPEVIQSAYKRLSRMYHPDTNFDQDEKMKQINLAFEVLSNTSKRTQYHKEWLEHFAPNSSKTFTFERVRITNDQALDAIDDYFHSLKIENWESAYLKLTLEDKSRIPLQDFIDCKTAVAKCYQLQGYKISYYKTYYNCTIENTLYERIIEYAVSVTDLNNRTYEITNEVLHKYVAFNGVSWNVHLGQNSLKNSILKFTLLSDKTEHFDPMSIYEKAAKRYDNLTGLLSESGFYEEALREVDRNRRYQNPFSLISFKVICVDNVPETVCVMHAANVIRKNLRINDVSARFGSNQFVCLLAETKRSGAEIALKKLYDIMISTQNQRYDIGTGVAEYGDFPNLDAVIYEVCSSSNYYDNSIIDSGNSI